MTPESQLTQYLPAENSHCPSGMVFAVNPNANKTFAAFQVRRDHLYISIFQISHRFLRPLLKVWQAQAALLLQLAMGLPLLLAVVLLRRQAVAKLAVL